MFLLTMILPEIYCKKTLFYVHAFLLPSFFFTLLSLTVELISFMLMCLSIQYGQKALNVASTEVVREMLRNAPLIADRKRDTDAAAAAAAAQRIADAAAAQKIADDAAAAAQRIADAAAAKVNASYC